MQIEFVHDVGPVGIHRLRADEEPFRDLVVGVAFSDQFENLALALGEGAVAVTLLAGPNSLEIVADHHGLRGR